ncbi:MAG: hypothetical protein HOU81_23600 [Hamadaea sp.]|uniref:hypothetical protein n=1 Tax=Hamadaea sp. TaxID=2024425 RepID=UPI0017E5A340|nr:hypothetical protein [Hamadaea sp.]NUR73810.1 hypothetical protein [Hamadaea sp.]NUT24282.1 hypothetical protein [Hamadaea sp.]
MNELMNQEFFDERMATPPPSTIDIDRIVAHRRRRALVRRSAATGSAALASVAAIAVAFALAGSARSQPIRPPTAAASSTTATPGSFAIRTGTEADRQATLDSLQTALEYAMATNASGVAWVFMPDLAAETPGPDGHPEMHASAYPQAGFSARSGLAADGERAGFNLRLSAPGCATVKEHPGAAVCNSVYDCAHLDSASTCHQTTTVTGLPLTTWTSRDQSGARTLITYGAQVLVRGGYILKVYATNQWGGDADAISTTEPILTPAQVAAISVQIGELVTG